MNKSWIYLSMKLYMYMLDSNMYIRTCISYCIEIRYKVIYINLLGWIMKLLSWILVFEFHVPMWFKDIGYKFWAEFLCMDLYAYIVRIWIIASLNWNYCCELYKYVLSAWLLRRIEYNSIPTEKRLSDLLPVKLFRLYV